MYLNKKVDVIKKWLWIQIIITYTLPQLFKLLGNLYKI